MILKMPNDRYNQQLLWQPPLNSGCCTSNQAFNPGAKWLSTYTNEPAHLYLSDEIHKTGTAIHQ
jgi:hypothetical protein